MRTESDSHYFLKERIPTISYLTLFLWIAWFPGNTKPEPASLGPSAPQESFQKPASDFQSSSVDEDSVMNLPTTIVPPFASLIEFAEEHNIPLSQIELGNENSQPAKGDRITLLMTLIQGEARQQWIGIISQENLSDAETRLPPMPDEVMYTSTGEELRYKNTRTVLDVRLIGPFAETNTVDSAKLTALLSRSHRTILSREQLSFGLDRYARTAMEFTARSNAVGVKVNDLFYIGAPSRLTSDQLAQGKRFAKIIHPTEEEERIVFSVTFALNAFLSAALEIDDFNRLINLVLNRPSIWSIVSELGVDRFLNYDPGNVRPIDASHLGLHLPAYELPLRLDLNGSPALRATIIMTAARPPLQTCAGIVEIYAENPMNRGDRLLIQLIAARRSTTSTR